MPGLASPYPSPAHPGMEELLKNWIQKLPNSKTFKVIVNFVDENSFKMLKVIPKQWNYIEKIRIILLYAFGSTKAWLDKMIAWIKHFDS